jgi:hypothetical protein
MHKLNSLLGQVQKLRNNHDQFIGLPQFERKAICLSNTERQSEEVIRELQEDLSSEQIEVGWLRTQSSLIYLPKQLCPEDGMPLSGEWVKNIKDKSITEHLNYVSDGKWFLTTWEERSLKADETISDGEHEVLSQEIKLLGSDKNEFTYHVYWKGHENAPSAIDRFGARFVSIQAM